MAVIYESEASARYVLALAALLLLAVFVSVSLSFGAILQKS